MVRPSTILERRHDLGRGERQRAHLEEDARRQGLPARHQLVGQVRQRGVSLGGPFTFDNCSL